MSDPPERLRDKLDPAVTAKPLAASKTVWGTAIAYVLSNVVTRFGLGLDETAVQIVSGVIVMATVTVLRKYTKAPISGIITTKEPGREPDHA